MRKTIQGYAMRPIGYSQWLRELLRVKVTVVVGNYPQSNKLIFKYR